MKIALIDANILVRFLVKDDPVLTAKAEDILSQGNLGKISLYLDEVVLAETIWVIHSFYKIPKNDFITPLIEIVSQDWIINPRKNLLLKALSLYRQRNLSYIDCWLHTLSQENKISLLTFDKNSLN